MIKPTIGRVVWFWPLGSRPTQEDCQPFPALVCFVHSDTEVNLAVFDRNGDPRPYQYVYLYQGEGERPGGPHCEWMPYQKGQAAKQEASTSAVVGMEAIFSRIAAIEKAQIEVASALNGGAKAAATVSPPPPIPPTK